MARKNKITPKQRALQIIKRNNDLDKALAKVDKRIDKAPMNTLAYFYQKDVRELVIELWD